MGSDLRVRGVSALALPVVCWTGKACSWAGCALHNSKGSRHAVISVNNVHYTTCAAMLVALGGVSGPVPLPSWAGTSPSISLAVVSIQSQHTH